MRSPAAALRYLEHGWMPVPIPARSKNPGFDGWQKFRVTAEQIPQHFAESCNIGVILGASSNGLVDIDLDSAEALAIAPEYLPRTAIFGRAGKRNSHWEYVAPGAKTTQFRDPIKLNGKNETIIELRSTGGQTVFPPSVHPSGETIEWSNTFAEPITIDPADLLAVVERVAAAALLAKHWPGLGSRHDAAMCLGGALLHSGWSVAEATNFVRIVCTVAGCEDIDGHVATVASSARKHASGESVKGWPALTECIGEHGNAVTTAVRKWLHLGTLPQRAAQTLAAAAGKTLDDFPERIESRPQAFDRKNSMQAPKIDPHRYALTDLGNAERLVRDHGKDLRYCPPKKKWLIWNGCYWKTDETGELARLAKATARSIYDEAAACDDDDDRKAITKHALSSERAPRIAAMIELAQSEPGIPVLPHELDANPWLFCCDNGTINLRTGELHAHQREDLITRISPVEYDADATSALWDTYLEMATNRDKELEAYIRRACGYSLQGTVTERKFFFVFGPPGGTKSTFLETVGAMFGAYHQPADSDTWLLQAYPGGNRGDLVRLAGARFVTSVEVRKEARFDEALIKRVTGGDPLTAAAKYESEVTFQPALTLWLAANDPPAIRDDDEGMWARICRIPFTHALSAAEQDHTMRERLREPKVLSAVLAWAVRGCLEWQRQGIGTCAAVDASVAEYRTSMDRAAGFLDGECCYAPNVRVLSTRFRRAYEQWCDENAIKPISGKEMATRLRSRGCTDEKSAGYRYWVGVRLVDELFDQRCKPASGGTAGSAGTADPRNSPMSRPRGDFTGTGDPGDPGDPIDYEAEERRALQS